ncbi:MAG: hypothetical protein ACM3ZC_13570 [Bacteroidota bacterium]
MLSTRVTKWAVALIVLAIAVLLLLGGLRWAGAAIGTLVLGWLARNRGRPGAAVQHAATTAQGVKQGQAADAKVQQSLNAQADALRERQKKRKGLAGLLLFIFPLIVFLAAPVTLAAPAAPDWQELYKAAEADLDQALAIIDAQRALLAEKDARIGALLTEIDTLAAELVTTAAAKDALIAAQAAQIADLQRPRWGVGVGAEVGLDGQPDYSLRLIRAGPLLGLSGEYAIREHEFRGGFIVFW